MPKITIAEALKIARDHYLAGETVEAEAACRKILAQVPEQADAMHLLGYLTVVRDREAGIAMMRRAIRINPHNPDFHHNLAVVLQSNKMQDEALAGFRQAIALRPNYAEAHFHLGNVLTEKNKPEEALAAYRQAIAIRPGYVAAHNALVVTLRNLFRHDEAIAAAKKALEISPDLYDAHTALGMSHHDKDEPAEAVAAFRQAVAVNPQSAPGFVNLAVALRRMGNAAEGIEASLKAAELDPASHGAYLSLGNCLRSCHRYVEAETAYRKSIELKPDYADAYDNLGAALRDQARFDEAIVMIRKALALKPDTSNAHWNYALALLLSGDFANGWVEYEWRWMRQSFTKKHRNHIGPRWYGSDPAGKTILVRPEQGFGDSIQMVRYIPLLAARGARVLLQCHPETRRLMSTVEGVCELRLHNEPASRFDLQMPAMSLPLAFETDEKTIPVNIPYLRVDPESAASWAARINSDAGRLRVGLVWAGHPKHEDDRRRSIALAALAPLGLCENVEFFSLQKGPGAKQLADAPPPFAMTDLGAELKDFADTAAVIANLDLVITVDTAVAHLAGALGKPCWVLLATVNDWRWMLDREDSPWYPSLRLFRQPRGEGWEGVIQRVADELGRAKRKD